MARNNLERMVSQEGFPGEPKHMALMGWVYTPTASAPPKVPLGEKKVVILTDAKEKDTNTNAMVKRFAKNFDGPVEVFNLWDVDIKGGCLGCCGNGQR